MHNAPEWKMLLYLFVLGFITTLYKEWKRNKGEDPGLMLSNAVYLYAPLIGLAGLAAYTDYHYVMPLALLLLGVYLFLAVYDAKRRKKEQP